MAAIISYPFGWKFGMKKYFVLNRIYSFYRNMKIPPYLGGISVSVFL